MQPWCDSWPEKRRGNLECYKGRENESNEANVAYRQREGRQSIHYRSNEGALIDKRYLSNRRECKIPIGISRWGFYDGGR